MALLSLTEAARRAGVTRMAAWCWIRDRRVGCVHGIRGTKGRVLLIPEEDVAAQAARIKALGPWGRGRQARIKALAAEAAKAAEQVAA